MGSRITIGSVAGVEIRIHRSWIIIALLIAWSFWGRFSAAEHATAVALAMAAAATVLFFGSVLAHELAHSLEARHRGVDVSGITLFLFGGATETRFDVDRPRDEFALTAVGPFSSLVLAALFGLVAFYGDGAGLSSVAQVAGLLGWVNLALAVFNLLPGAPLDGGRILRSLVWAVTGDRRRAVRVAARSGQVLGLVIGGLGLLQLFFVPGAIVGGLWLMFIGWFLAGAAQSEILQQTLHERLRGLTVGELLPEGSLPAIDGSMTLDAAAAELRRRAEDALAVTHDGRVMGVVSLDDVADVPAEARSAHTVGDVTVPVDELPQLDATTEIADALSQLGRERPLVVMAESGDTVRGVITPEQLQRIVSRTMKLGADPRAAARASVDGESHLPERRSS